MGEHEIAPLAASQMMAWAAVVSAAAAAVAAVGIWVFGIGMMRSNARRADTEKNRHDQIMAAFKDAAEDRKAAIAAAAEDRKAIAAQMARQAEQAAEDRKAIAAQMARQAEQAAKDRKAAQEETTQAVAQAVGQAVGQAVAQTASDRKAIQGLLTALENQGKALEKILTGASDPDNGNGNVTPISKRGGPAK